MNDPNLEEQIAAASAYQELHVPALFEEWTGPVLDGAEVRPGQRLLDVACGTGVLARAASERVGPNGSVAGLDPNAGMLEVAASLDSGVEWRRGVAEDLPFADASFDAVVSQFGLMFFTNRSAAVTEMLRVLMPGGRLAVAVWAALEESPAYSLEVALLERLAGTPAADALRAPFVLGDRLELESLFRDAGANEVQTVSLTATARFPSIRRMVEADLRGWLPVMGVELTEDQISEVLAAAETELSTFLVPDGRVVFPSPGHIVMGRKEA